MVNATGWTQLYNGDLLGAAYVMYNTAFLGYVVTILFFVYQAVLYMKTKNLQLCWITGVFFASLFAISSFYEPAQLPLMFILLVFEMAGILYGLLFK